MKPFPTSAACCFGILFISVLLITTGSSEVQVVGLADPVVALIGDDVILPCSLKPRVNAENMVVEWTRLNLTTTENVHLYRQGRDSNEDQFPSYRRRTSLFIDELKSGNFSLKLTRVTLSDAGSYRCLFPILTSQVKETTVQLIVDEVFPKSQVGLIVGLIAAAVIVIAASAGGGYMWRKHKEKKHREKLRREKGDAQFVDMNRVHLIQTVTTVIPIAFYLIRSEKYSEIHAAGTREDQMELLYQALDSGGVKMKSDFYRILQDLQPDAVKDLAPSTMQFDYRFPKSRMWWIVLLLIAAAIVLTAFAVVYLQRELEDYRFPKSHLGLIVGLLIAAAVGVLAASAVVGYMWRKHEGVSDEEDPSSPPSTMQFEELIRLNEENDRISLIDT